MTQGSFHLRNPSGFDLVLRGETLPLERRTLLTPDQAAQLTANGFRIAVEHWHDRIFSEHAYADAVRAHGKSENFKIIEPHDWHDHPDYARSVILGIKNIPQARPGQHGFSMAHSCVHFDHSYKSQPGWHERLARFLAPSAVLLDHEYCVDDNGVRTHAFGSSAGYATAAMAFMAWAQKINGQDIRLPQLSYDSPDDFFAFLIPDMQAAIAKAGFAPQAVIIGGERGRSAGGARAFINDLTERLAPTVLPTAPLWDRVATGLRESNSGEGLYGIEHYDIVLNCTFTKEPCRPFVTDATLEKRGGKLQILGDVTCDTGADKNRFRVSGYKTTEFTNPAVHVGHNVYAITIDHSPSLFPAVASRDVAAKFFPLLQDLLTYRKHHTAIPEDTAWGRCLKTFRTKMKGPAHIYNAAARFADETHFPAAGDAKFTDAVSTHQTNIIRQMMERAGFSQTFDAARQAPQIQETLYFTVLGLMHMNDLGSHQRGAKPAPGQDLSEQISLSQQVLTEAFRNEALPKSRRDWAAKTADSQKIPVLSF